MYIWGHGLNLLGNIGDSWTPEQRQKFIEDWMDEEPLIREDFGRKRRHDEMSGDGAGASIYRAC